MQMISDFMHFDTVALWQKNNAIWKVDGYNIRSVYLPKIYTTKSCHEIISNNGLLVRAITDILFYIDLIGTMVEIN